MRLRNITAGAIVLLLLCLQTLPTMAQDRIETGTINDDNPYEEIFVTIEERDQMLTLDILPTSGDLDTLLYLVDGNLNIIAQNDDRAKDDFSSYLQFPEIDPGNYTVIATRYGVIEGDSSGDFELSIGLTELQDDRLTYDVSDEALLAAGFPEIDPKPEAEWTVLAYYGGDTNLEQAVLNDFKEFEIAGGSTDNVRVVIMMDRHPENATVDGNWATTRIYEAAADTTTAEDEFTLNSELLVDFGQKDTGNGENFARFLTWGVQNYPAQNYAVALASHGAGWRGIITDDTAGYTILSLPELRAAFNLATDAAGTESFELLINDACLMSSIEYHQAVADYFDYSIASPEIVVDPALDMTLFLETIRNEPDIALETLGQSLVDTYITRDILNRPGADNIYLTNSVTDLNNFSSLVRAINRFANLVNRNPSAYSGVIGNARANTYTYTAFLGGEELIDLGSLMNQVISLSTDNQLIIAAENVLEELDNTVVYGNAGDRAAIQTTYHNIYFPSDSSDFESSYFDDTALDSWGQMLRNYYNIVTPQVWGLDTGELLFHPPTAPKVRLSRLYPLEISTLFPLSGILQVVGRNIAYVDQTIDQIQPDGTLVRVVNERIGTNLVTDEGTITVNDWSDGVNNINYFWAGDLPVVTDGTTSANELMLIDRTSGVASLDGRYRAPDSEQWSEVTVVFDLAGNVQRIVNRSENSALGVIDIPPGSTFQSFKAIVSPDGRVRNEVGTEYIWEEEGLNWETLPAPSGQYNLGLLATAFGGTTGFTSVTTLVNNDGVDPSLTGVNITQLRTVLAYPKNWSDIGADSERLFFRTTTAEDDGNLTIYILFPGFTADVIDEDVVAMVDGFASFHNVDIDPVFTPITVDGFTGLQFDYEYAEDEETVSGRGIAMYRPDLGYGVVYAAERVEGEVEDIYEYLDEYLLIYDSSSIPDTREWNTEIGEFASIPTRSDWVLNEGDFWREFTPEDSEEASFMRLATFVTEETDAANLRDEIITERISPELTDLQQTTRSFTTETESWEVSVYDATRDGNSVTGRVYTTLVDDIAHIVWVETVNDEMASDVFSSVFETVIDGYDIN